MTSNQPIEPFKKPPPPPSKIPVLIRTKVSKYTEEFTPVTQVLVKKKKKMSPQTYQNKISRCDSLRGQSTPNLDKKKPKRGVRSLYKSSPRLEEVQHFGKVKEKACAKEREVVGSGLSRIPRPKTKNKSSTGGKLKSGTAVSSQPIKTRSTTLRTPFHSAPTLSSSQKRNLNSFLSTSNTNFVRNKHQSMSLLDRSSLNQKEYMKLLSLPNKQRPITSTESGTTISNKVEKYKKEPCPPRLYRLSLPKKRQVLETWKNYGEVLSSEVLVRFDKILQSHGNDLEPKEARHFFKQLDQKKLRKRMKKKRKKCPRPTDEAWLKKEIEETSKIIVDYLEYEPLHTLTFFDMVISDQLLHWLQQSRVITKKKITKDCYLKTVVQLCDKISTWIVKFNTSIEVHALVSSEQLSQVKSFSLSSLSTSDEDDG